MNCLQIFNPMNKILQHNQIKHRSKPVTSIEEQVIPVIAPMVMLCRKKIGRMNNIIALAHCQVKPINPLTFFVFRDGVTVVNPEIIEVMEATKFTHKEGCASYCYRPDKKVTRYQSIYVKYTMVKAEEVREITEWVHDLTACVFQHEIDHFRNKYIY
jgi:peptide deformylase